MSEIQKFGSEFELPYRFRAYAALDELLPALKQKQLENVTDPVDLESIQHGWYCICFDDKPLKPPTLSNERAELAYLEIPYLRHPSENSPLYEIAILTYSDDSLIVTSEDDKYGKMGSDLHGYSAYFGPEMEPFVISWDNDNLSKDLDQPYGDRVASWEGKRPLTDNECEALVGLIASNVDRVSDQIV